METSSLVVDGVRIAYRRCGSGPPLVILHGGFEDSRAWIDDLERLGSTLDVIAWDAPGCGASDDVPQGWTDHDWADAAHGFITGLGLEAPAVVGFSLGSIIALLLARDHPGTVGRLVLVGAYAGWGGSVPPDELARRVEAMHRTAQTDPDEWADDFLHTALPHDAPAARRAQARLLLAEWRPSTTLALLDVMVQDFRADLPGIGTPTVVVRGADDARSSHAAAQEICTLLPTARLLEIDGAGHDCAGPELDTVLIDAARNGPAGTLPE